jgi:hypothetical protein
MLFFVYWAIAYRAVVLSFGKNVTCIVNALLL